MAHWDVIIVPSGYSDPVQFSSGGNPYGVSATATEEGIVQDIEEAVKQQQDVRLKLLNGSKMDTEMDKS